MHQISVIGSGHVAHHFIKFFNNNENFELIQVYARNFNSLKDIIKPEQYINEIKNLKPVDIILICVSDHAIASVSKQILLTQALILHTSGSQPMSTLSHHQRFGVLYPLQTFSKFKALNFSNIPICIESYNKNEFQVLNDVANKISNQVYEISSEQRKILHLAAVFVCNFANHLYHIGANLCEENDINFNLLIPLISETAHKINSLHPKDAQTGPALRGDINTMQNHIDLLKNDDLKSLYLLMSKMIKTNEL